MNDRRFQHSIETQARNQRAILAGANFHKAIAGALAKGREEEEERARKDTRFVLTQGEKTGLHCLIKGFGCRAERREMEALLVKRRLKVETVGGNLKVFLPHQSFMEWLRQDMQTVRAHRRPKNESRGDNRDA